MKTIIAAMAALFMVACSGTSESAETTRQPRPMTEPSALSGSATNPQMVRRGNTINDHDKLLEMCESMRLGDCEATAMRCHQASDAASCMRNGSNQ